MIPVNEPFFDGNEKKYLAECIDTGWVSSDGPFVKKFESQFASYIGVKHGISNANGTAAIEIALYALGVGPGDEVIIPSFTIISCVLGVLRLGAIPIVIDIEPETWCIDTTLIEKAITSKTKVVMPVHMYGHPAEMDPIFKLRDKYGFKILEDAAEVHGAEYYSEYLGGKWVKCGALGDISTFSFYANKIITTGEGGMVLTNSDSYAKRAQDYRNLCFIPEERFHHEELGYNFRLSNLQAAVGVAQLEQIDRFVTLKQKFGEYYRDQLASIEGVRFQQVKPNAKSVYWMYCIELDSRLGITAFELRQSLLEFKIGTRPFFKGMHLQPCLSHIPQVANAHCPVTEYAYNYGLYLPSGLALTEEQVQEVCQSIKRILKEKIVGKKSVSKT